MVHKAAAQFSAAVTAGVSSGIAPLPKPFSQELICIVVIFGDPDNPDPVGDIPASKVYIDCHPEDLICQGSFITDSEHFDVSRASLSQTESC